MSVEGTGLIRVHAPVVVLSFQTSPLVPSNGPAPLLKLMTSWPFTSTPCWGRKPTGWPGTAAHVAPPSVLRQMLGPVFVATPTKMVRLGWPREPLVGSNACQTMPSGSPA